VEESGYDLSKASSPGHAIDAKPYGSNDTQKMVQKLDDEIVTPRVSLGYRPPQPVKFSRWCKDKRSLAQYVMAEEAENGKVTTLSPTQNHRCSTSCSHRYHNNVLMSLAFHVSKTPKPSMSRRLKGGKRVKLSVFTRIKTGAKSLSSSPAQDGNSVFSHLGEVNDVQNSIPSSTKCISTLDVKTDDSLKVKRCTLVITNCKASPNSKEKIKGDGQDFFHLITIQEANDLEDEIEYTEVLKTLENAKGFQHGLVNGKFLKHHLP